MQTKFPLEEFQLAIAIIHDCVFINQEFCLASMICDSLASYLWTYQSCCVYAKKKSIQLNLLSCLS